MAIWALLVALAGLLASCSGEAAGGPGGGVVGGGGGEVLEVVVGAERVGCVGVAPMECLVVDGELFYGEIEGFDYREGYRYRILMERYDPWGGGEPPQDAGRYGYRLVRVVERVRVR